VTLDPSRHDADEKPENPFAAFKYKNRIYRQI
jgi:hypothetical protein